VGVIPTPGGSIYRAGWRRGDRCRDARTSWVWCCGARGWCSIRSNVSEPLRPFGPSTRAWLVAFSPRRSVASPLLCQRRPPLRPRDLTTGAGGGGTFKSGCLENLEGYPPTRRDLDLQLLEDDENIFAVYNPSLNIRKDTLDQYPQLEKVFAPISKELDTQTLRKLNYAVDIEGESPETVAERWLKDNGFIE